MILKPITYLYRSFLLLLIGFILFPSAGMVYGQTPVLIDDQDFRTDAQAAIDSLYNQNPAGAEQVLKPWKQSYPEHPIWSLWDGMEFWWKVLQDLPDQTHDEEFFESMKRADYAAAELLRKERDHPDALIIRSVANGYVARHYSNREEWVTSLNVARKAYQAHQRLLEVYPELPDNSFAEGLKYYYSAYLPEAYPVVKAVSWFLPEGDKEKGLNELKLASIEGIFSRPEAAYFLGNIQLNYEEDYESASIHFKNLVKTYPDNGYYRRLQIRTLFQQNDYGRVLAAADSSLNHWDRNQGLTFPGLLKEELLYWKGRALYQQGQLERAYRVFKESVEIGRKLPNPKNRPFQTLSAYYAGRTLERVNEREEAKKYYQIAASQNEKESQARDMAKTRLSAL